MTKQLKIALAGAATLLAAGCGSGGGYGETKVTYSSNPIIKPPVDHGCGTVPGYDIPCVSRFPVFPGDPGYVEPTISLPPELIYVPVIRPVGPVLTSWAEAPRLASSQFDSIEGGISWSRDKFGGVTATYGGWTQTPSPLQWGPNYYPNGDLHEIPLRAGSGEFWAAKDYQPWNYTFTNLGDVGQPGIDLVVSKNTSFGEVSPFTHADSIAVIANPQALGWNYQSFGVWNDELGSTGLQLRSFGAATPASAIPVTGSATFSGKLAGGYVSPQGTGTVASADLAVNVNFADRTLAFASTNTVLGTVAWSKVAAPNLNLGGTLTYSPGVNSFSGTLTSAGGTMSGKSTGQFYGPAAQELGGVFAVKSATTVETFAGAYGAKR